MIEVKLPGQEVLKPFSCFRRLDMASSNLYNLIRYFDNYLNI